MQAGKAYLHGMNAGFQLAYNLFYNTAPIQQPAVLGAAYSMMSEFKESEIQAILDKNLSDEDTGAEIQALYRVIGHQRMREIDKFEMPMPEM